MDADSDYTYFRYRCLQREAWIPILEYIPGRQRSVMWEYSPWNFMSWIITAGLTQKTITVTVDSAPLPVPPAPVNLGVTQGNFWIEYSWEPGIGSITDSYNLNVNGAPYTTSLTTRSDTVGPHGWSNITVWAYNNFWRPEHEFRNPGQPGPE